MMKCRSYVIPSLALFILIVLIFIGPIPQKNSYHHFADQRRFVGIDNFLNVITNLPFALVGLLGFITSMQIMDKGLKHITILLFIGFVILTLGSGYYHLSPNNITLAYDRLSITIIFMSFFSFLIYDRINKRAGYLAFLLLNLIGPSTVIYWIISENAGRGDLRWYAMIQFFPIIAIPLVLWLYRSRFNHGREIVPVFIFFGIAKLSESYDSDIYAFSNEILSGHSLKHLFMAMAGYYIVKLIRRRASNLVF